MNYNSSQRKNYNILNFVIVVWTNKRTIYHMVMIKNQNIGRYKYIGNRILWIYKIYRFIFLQKYRFDYIYIYIYIYILMMPRFLAGTGLERLEVVGLDQDCLTGCTGGCWFVWALDLRTLFEALLYENEDEDGQ